jgi:y4mF family transcriptional regulator
MHIILNYLVFLYVNAYKMNQLSEFVKSKRKQLGLTQEEFAEKAGVALTVIRKIEQGKENLSLSKVNQVLSLFGHVLVPTNEKNATRIS